LVEDFGPSALKKLFLHAKFLKILNPVFEFSVAHDVLLLLLLLLLQLRG